MDKTFTFFGISYYRDDYKVRFANAASRVKVLERAGHSDVRLVEVDEPMRKLEGIMAIRDLDLFQDAAAQLAIDRFLDAEEVRNTRADTAQVRGRGRPKRDVEDDITVDDATLAMAAAIAAKERELVPVIDDDEDQPF